MGALEDRIDADLALGNDVEVIGEIESLIASNPMQERLRGQLMLALYRAGRQTDALAVYRQTSELLREELGLEPSRQLQELERSILKHDTSLDAADATATHGGSAGVCPFKGLAFFDRADAEYFCGREGLVSDLLARLVDSPLVGILGPSGIGKSSLLRAGLLPALNAGLLPGSAGWRQVLLRPGAHPDAELRRAVSGDRLGQALDGSPPASVWWLRSTSSRSCSPCVSTRTSARRSSTRSSQRRRIRSGGRWCSSSLRADFYGRLSSYPRFAGLLSRSHVLVGPMDREELGASDRAARRTRWARVRVGIGRRARGRRGGRAGRAAVALNGAA